MYITKVFKKLVRFSRKSCKFSKNVRIFVSDFLVNKPTTMVCNCTSPEVQSNHAENSHTGVSSDCVHKEKKQWFVLRATYGRAEKALGVLQTANVETYLPMHYVVKEINGKRKL